MICHLVNLKVAVYQLGFSYGGHTSFDFISQPNKHNFPADWFRLGLDWFCSNWIDPAGRKIINHVTSVVSTRWRSHKLIYILIDWIMTLPNGNRGLMDNLRLYVSAIDPTPLTHVWPIDRLCCWLSSDYSYWQASLTISAGQATDPRI